MRLRERGEDGVHNLVLVHQASGTAVSAGEVALGGADDFVVGARGEDGRVLLRGGVFPHGAVHGGEEKDRPAVGEVQAGKGVGSQAARHAGHGVGGGGNDGQHVRLLRQLDVHRHPALRLILEGGYHGVA